MNASTTRNKKMGMGIRNVYTAFWWSHWEIIFQAFIVSPVIFTAMKFPQGGDVSTPPSLLKPGEVGS